MMPALAAYREAVERHVEESVSPYTELLSSRADGSASASKEVNDPIWGTLVLKPLEVLVLDSPLMQRLRRVRQLGVAHYVFPAAGHSRLEHSLGVLLQTQQLVNAANERSVGALRDGPAIDKGHEVLLRLAALCHDIGHGFMSHVSENALQFLPISEQIRNEFRDDLGRQLKWSEINSYFILTSQAWSGLLKECARVSATALTDGDPQKIADIITGQIVADAIPFLQEIVSGPFDADKLDYLTRDAYMSGVPIVTDVPRLLRKIRSVDTEPSRLPASIREAVVEQPLVTIIAVERSGNRTLDELTLARTLMFDKIYRHQKVRAIEAMVASMVTSLARAVGEETAIELCLKLTDDDILQLQHRAQVARVCDEAGISGVIDSPHIEVVSQIALWLTTRQLFVRCAAFLKKMSADPFQRHPEQRSALGKLLLTIEDSFARREIATGISEVGEAILEALGRQDTLGSLPTGRLEPYVWVDPPRTPEDPTATANAMLVTEDGRVSPFQEESPETTNWAVAYHQARDSGYVYCPQSVVVELSLATEYVFAETFGIRMPSWMLAFGSEQRERLEADRRALERVGFYRESPRYLLPEPERLRQADVKGRLQEIRVKLQGYQGPQLDQRSVVPSLINDDALRSFLSQFREDKFIDAALRMLAEVRIVGRAEIVACLDQMLSNNEDLSGSSIVPLGSPKDSGSPVAYFAGDIVQRHDGIRVLSLSDALSAPAPIIFVDDFIGSGRQSEAILRSVFGDFELADELGEERYQLAESLQVELRNRPIGFAYASGLSDGLGNIVDVAAALGLHVIDAVALVRDDEIPTIETDVAFDHEDDKHFFLDRCREIGLELLADQGTIAEERALGYGNLGLLLAFPYNTPAQTLTLLWEKGTLDGAPWLPLLPRRRKK